MQTGIVIKVYVNSLPPKNPVHGGGGSVCRKVLDKAWFQRRHLNLGTAILYRGTSLIRKRAPIGPYSRNMPTHVGSYGSPRGGGGFL